MAPVSEAGSSAVLYFAGYPSRMAGTRRIAHSISVSRDAGGQSPAEPARQEPRSPASPLNEKVIHFMRPTDIRIEAVSHSYEDFLYRTPIKFGGIAVDRVTLLNVQVRVRTVAGKTATGFGSMPLGNVWSFPSRVLSYDETLAAMKTLAERVSRLFGDCTEVGHPIDLSHALETA